MNWKQSLGHRKFYAILAASAVEMIVGILASLVDTAIAGHLIGTVGLSVMNLMAPVTGIAMFTESIFSVGASMVYAHYKGQYQEEKAHTAFGAGLICSVLIGILTALAVGFLMPLYMDYLGVSASIRDTTMDYLFFICPQIAISPISRLIGQMVLTDGGEAIGSASNVTEILLNLVLSIILGSRMGALGIALGTLISTIVGLGVAMLHFLNKRNSLRIRFGFDKADVKDMIIFGTNDAAFFMLLPILAFVTTKFVTLRFGEFYLPLLTVLYSTFEIGVIFEAVGEAMRPIMPIYMGDNNTEAIKNLLKSSLFVNMLLSVVFGLVLFLAAPFIPMAFDITEPELLKECSFALRVFALSCPGMALTADFISFYLNSGKAYLSVLGSILKGLVCILLPGIPLGLIFGIRGLVSGFFLAPYLTAVILFLYVYLRYGKENFPILIASSDDAHLNRTIKLSQENIMSLVYEAHEFLEQNGVNKRSQNRVEVTIEELLLLIRDKNKELNPKCNPEDIYAECYLRISKEEVDMSLWDSGEIFDITEEDSKLFSFRGYFVERFLTQQREKKHMTATSFNKNFCRFQFHKD